DPSEPGLRPATRQDQHRPGPQGDPRSDRGGSGGAAQGNGERMTNTLHRYGKSESFFDDYIVFSLPAKSKAAGQTGDALAAQKRFMQIAAEYKPVSLGDALHGGTLRPTKSTSIFGHWGKRNRPNFKKVLEGMS